MKRVLVIEDDLVVGTVYKRFLQAHGFAVEVAKDGATGLQQIPVFEPDAVVLDLMLPKLNGISVLTVLRAQPQYQHLPVIVLTNACLPTFVEQALQAGANRVLDKSKDTPLVMLGILQALVGIESDRRLGHELNT